MANINANQIGSNPREMSEGPTIGTITKTIWKKSKKKPKIKIVTITKMKALFFDPGISVKKFSTNISPPNPLKTNEKSEAPIKIKKTIGWKLYFLTWKN